MTHFSTHKNQQTNETAESERDRHRKRKKDHHFRIDNAAESEKKRLNFDISLFYVLQSVLAENVYAALWNE